MPTQPLMGVILLLRGALLITRGLVGIRLRYCVFMCIKAIMYSSFPFSPGELISSSISYNIFGFSSALHNDDGPCIIFHASAFFWNLRLKSIIAFSITFIIDYLFKLPVGRFLLDHILSGKCWLHYVMNTEWRHHQCTHWFAFTVQFLSESEHKVSQEKSRLTSNSVRLAAWHHLLSAFTSPFWRKWMNKHILSAAVGSCYSKENRNDPVLYATSTCQQQ